MTTLSAFESWMVDRNLEYIKAEGIADVVSRLRNRGYYRVANAVLVIHNEQESLKQFKQNLKTI